MSIFDSLLPGYRSGVRVSRGPTKQQPIEQPHNSRTRASTNTKLSEERISGHTISKTCQSLTSRVSERTHAQEERARSPAGTPASDQPPRLVNACALTLNFNWA